MTTSGEGVVVIEGLFAFTTSEVFAAAVTARREEIRRFDAEVVGAYHDEHPELPPVSIHRSWTAPGDYDLVGFADRHPNDEPPVGLSRSGKRDYLLPSRGSAGEQWRRILVGLGRRPNLTEVFTLHGVDVGVMDTGASLWRSPSMLAPPGEVWLLYHVRPPRPCGHLRPVRVSEFYRRMEDDQAAREGARSAAP